MKALGYFKGHSLKEFRLQPFDLKEPQIGSHDLLVRVKAISINPVDYKIRQNRSSPNEIPIILGWDASGVVEKIGSEVTNFKVGEEVFYAGDLNRPGTYAELQAVDSRIVALKPKILSFADAAALPLTSLTAYEALIAQKTSDLSEGSKTLIIGGAGGVGSMAIQLLKKLKNTTVIATASRSETREWCLGLGADFVIDHSKNLVDELSKIGIKEVDCVFSTTHSDKYFEVLPKIIKPFGLFVLIDDPERFDVTPFKGKSIRINWELMFTKTLFKHDLESQGKILSIIANLVDKKEVKTTLTKKLEGFSVDNLKEAHALLEGGTSMGKIVIDFKN